MKGHEQQPVGFMGKIARYAHLHPVQARVAEIGIATTAIVAPAVIFSGCGVSEQQLNTAISDALVMRDATSTTAGSTTTTAAETTTTAGSTTTSSSEAPTTTSSIAPVATTETKVSPVATTEKLAVLDTEFKFGNITFIGFPESVNPHNVDRANHTPFSTDYEELRVNSVLAYPGVVMYGEESRSNPDAVNNPSGAFFTKENNFILDGERSPMVEIPRGGFLMLQAGEGSIEIGHYDQDGAWVFDGQEIDLPQDDLPGGHQYFCLIRGRSDRAQVVRITGYVADHARVILYEQPGAFVDENQVLVQMAETAHYDGQRVLDVVTVDLRSTEQPVAAIRQSGMDASWELVGNTLPSGN